MGFEHGPFLAQEDGTLLLNPLSWNSAPATVVYIEQPAGVGFSYSSNASDYANAYNDTVAATDNAAFLSSFFDLYPQYKSLPLYLTGESYAGNYVPQWAAAVLAGTDERLKAQLKGFAVNNPGRSPTHTCWAWGSHVFAFSVAVMSIDSDTRNFRGIMVRSSLVMVLFDALPQRIPIVIYRNRSW